MNYSGSRWLRGCGIGCGILTVILLAVGLSVFFFVRKSIVEIGEIEASTVSLMETYGEIENYTPAADGAVPAERLERFLEVRQSLAEARTGLEQKLATLIPEGTKNGGDGFRTVMKILRGLGDLIPEIATFLKQRNQTLIQAEMGLGEYLYLYALSYHSWLGHPPDDGPTVDDGSGEERLLDGKNSAFGRVETFARYNRYARAMLRNQLAVLDGTAENEDPWRNTLADELAQLESKPKRILWEDGLPERIQVYLEPYRTQLEQTYHQATNCFEYAPIKGEKWNVNLRN